MKHIVKEDFAAQKQQSFDSILLLKYDFATIQHTPMLISRKYSKLVHRILLHLYTLISTLGFLPKIKFITANALAALNEPLYFQAQILEKVQSC